MKSGQPVSRMLSRKQIWRKMKSVRNDQSQFQSLCGGAVPSSPNLLDLQESFLKDESNLITTPVAESKKLKSCLSFGNLARELRRDTRNLRFSSKVHVCLIPGRQELFAAAGSEVLYIHCISFNFICYH